MASLEFFYAVLSTLCKNAIWFIIGFLLTEPVHLMVYFNIIELEDTPNEEERGNIDYSFITKYIEYIGYIVMIWSVLDFLFIAILKSKHV